MRWRQRGNMWWEHQVIFVPVNTKRCLVRSRKVGPAGLWEKLAGTGVGSVQGPQEDGAGACQIPCLGHKVENQRRELNKVFTSEECVQWCSLQYF